MMTKSRALARARLLLGPKANVSSRRRTESEGKRESGPIYQVGIIESCGMRFFMVRGTGDSWEEALDDADRYVNAINVQLFAEDIEVLLVAAHGLLPVSTEQRLRRALEALQRREARRVG